MLEVRSARSYESQLRGRSSGGECGVGVRVRWGLGGRGMTVGRHHVPGASWRQRLSVLHVLKRGTSGWCLTLICQTGRLLVFSAESEGFATQGHKTVHALTKAACFVTT